MKIHESWPIVCTVFVETAFAGELLAGINASLDAAGREYASDEDETVPASSWHGMTRAYRQKPEFGRGVVLEIRGSATYAHRRARQIVELALAARPGLKEKFDQDEQALPDAYRSDAASGF